MSNYIKDMTSKYNVNFFKLDDRLNIISLFFETFFFIISMLFSQLLLNKISLKIFFKC